MKFVRDIKAVIPGEVYPRDFLKGADVPPALQDQAIAEGWAEKPDPKAEAKAKAKAEAEAKAKAEAEAKAKAGAPENK